ncbi:MAG: NUDIX domain-containing protein [Patescibacteria group bacterium]|jgi:8-oxo-dGTP diphosphatase
MKIDGLSVNLVLVKDGKVLMQLRDDKPDISNPGVWCIPGGSVEEGESINDAVSREFEEETGYLVCKPFLFYTEVYKSKVAIGKIIKRHVYIARYDGVQKIGCYEGQKMEFKSPTEFSQMKVFPDHECIVVRALELLG